MAPKPRAKPKSPSSVGGADPRHAAVLREFCENVAKLRKQAVEPFALKNNPRLEKTVDDAVRLCLTVFRFAYEDNGRIADGTAKAWPVRQLALSVMVPRWEPLADTDAAAALLLARMPQSVGYLDEFISLPRKESLLRNMLKTILLHRGLIKRKVQ